MKGLRCPIILALSLLSMAVSALAEPIKTATIDLLLQREGVGAVFIDDERGQIYFERIAPACFRSGVSHSGAVEELPCGVPLGEGAPQAHRGRRVAVEESNTRCRRHRQDLPKPTTRDLLGCRQWGR